MAASEAEAGPISIMSRSSNAVRRSPAMAACRLNPLHTAPERSVDRGRGRSRARSCVLFRTNDPGVAGQLTRGLPRRQHQLGAQAADRRGAEIERTTIKPRKLDHDREAEARAGLAL